MAAYKTFLYTQKIRSIVVVRFGAFLFGTPSLFQRNMIDGLALSRETALRNFTVAEVTGSCKNRLNTPVKLIIQTMYFLIDDARPRIRARAR